jgi:hypothetical protein
LTPSRTRSGSTIPASQRKRSMSSLPSRRRRGPERRPSGQRHRPAIGRKTLGFTILSPHTARAAAPSGLPRSLRLQPSPFTSRATCQRRLDPLLGPPAS